MRLKALSLLLIAVIGSPAFAQPFGPIWSKGHASIVVTPCPPGGDTDDSCRAVEVRRGASVYKLGAGYIVATVLWAREAKASGPDVLILGDDGGSGGDGDLFAVTLTPDVSIRKLQGERITGAAVRTGKIGERLKLDLAFDIEYFNGASHSGVAIVPLPIEWKNGDFALDSKVLTGRTFSPSELDFRALAMGNELQRWAEESYPAPRLFPPQSRSGSPVTVQALTELMLAGHADQAHALLDRSWPRGWNQTDRKLGGEDAFWSELCRAVAGHPWWKRFDLGRVPHADLIYAGAGAAPK